MGGRGWDSWMTSPIQWTWTWWGIGRPGMQQSMGSQRVRHNLTTEQQQQYIYSLGRLATIPTPGSHFSQVASMSLLRKQLKVPNTLMQCPKHQFYIGSTIHLRFFNVSINSYSEFLEFHCNKIDPSPLIIEWFSSKSLIRENHSCSMKELLCIRLQK